MGQGTGGAHRGRSRRRVGIWVALTSHYVVLVCSGRQLKPVTELGLAPSAGSETGSRALGKGSDSGDTSTANKAEADWRTDYMPWQGDSERRGGGVGGMAREAHQLLVSAVACKTDAAGTASSAERSTPRLATSTAKFGPGRQGSCWLCGSWKRTCGDYSAKTGRRRRDRGQILATYPVLLATTAENLPPGHGRRRVRAP